MQRVNKIVGSGSLKGKRRWGKLRILATVLIQSAVCSCLVVYRKGPQSRLRLLRGSLQSTQYLGYSTSMTQVLSKYCYGYRSL